MKQIAIISPLDAVDIFKQLGFDTLISDNAEAIGNYIKDNINEIKVFIYDFNLKEIIDVIKEDYRTDAFPIFVSLAFNEQQIEISIAEANRQIENAIGIKIE